MRCPSCSSRSSAPSSSMPWSSTEGTGCWKFRSSSKTPPRIGSGARSRCRAAACTSSSGCGARFCAGTSTSAPTSTPTWPPAARPFASRPATPMSTSARCMATAPRSRFCPTRRGSRAPRGRMSRSAGPRAARATACTPQAGSDAMDAIATLSRDEIRRRAEALGPWFHNIVLDGVATAPNHFLGDYPAVKWKGFSQAIPADLSGKTVLDIGCNGGFYSIEMKRRGAERVLGVDFDDDYLAQARFAADVSGLKIEFRKLSVYDVGALGERFDVVLFMGVLYHLRHPLLALDLIAEHVVGDLLVFQSMQRGSNEVDNLEENYDFWTAEQFDRPGFPKLHFIEHSFADDPTNWWVPNRACVEAMLRSAGFVIQQHPEAEVYLCRPSEDRPGVRR